MDFLNPSVKYELNPENVPIIHKTSKSFLQKSLVFCGGRDDVFNVSQDCVAIGTIMKTRENKTFAVSVTLDQRTLWIVGGYDIKYENLRLTEFLKLSQPSVNGTDFLFTVIEHSMIQYDEKSIYIIGRNLNGSISKKTWIADPTNRFRIRKGPPLNFRRQNHSCAKMTINGRTILVVAGGCESGKPLDSVEILDPSTNNNWTPGLLLKYVTLLK